jgi:hypothetical protein
MKRKKACVNCKWFSPNCEALQRIMNWPHSHCYNEAGFGNDNTPKLKKLKKKTYCGKFKFKKDESGSALGRSKENKPRKEKNKKGFKRSKTALVRGR